MRRVLSCLAFEYAQMSLDLQDLGNFRMPWRQVVAVDRHGITWEPRRRA